MLMVLYIHGSSLAPRRTRLLPTAVTTGVFAQVLVDIQVQELGDRLFTYRVPEHLLKETFVGAQVLVPFGHQEMVAGYVVALTDTAPRDVNVKDVVEILDSDPLFDSEYIEFLYWVADYYCASLASVIAAAIPPNFAPRLKRMVELASSEVIEPSNTTHLEIREEGCRRILGVLRAQARYSASLRS